MANVLNRVTKEYRVSVNEYLHPVVDWIHNPNLSAVAGQPVKWWKIAGDLVSLMNAAEQAAVDAALAAAAVATNRAEAKDEVDGRILKAFAGIMLDEINLLRVKAGLAQRTADQLRTAILNRIDEV